MLLPNEIEATTAWFKSIAPTILLIISCLYIGYLAGMQVERQEISRDCRYSNTFRIGTDSFECTRRL